MNNTFRTASEFFAPNIIAAEVLYVLCQKLTQGILTETEHEQSVELFINYMNAIVSPDGGDSSFIKRAEEIRNGYGCSRSSDCFYIALAEELSKTRPNSSGKCTVWSEEMSHRERHLATQKREDFGYGNGNSGWLTQLASNISTANSNY